MKFLQSFLLVLMLSVILAHGQSTNVDYPTAITSDSISGKIKARDIGDSRLTVHYYVFEGNQGDIFLKIEATNLNGDIDIFYADNLRPLTKVTLFAEASTTLTGWEIYLRKSERLILRVEGRTPNDESATYKIKFEGSFQAVAANSVENEPELPQLKTENESEVKVNSVGTIIETKPKVTVAKNTRRKGTKATTTPQSVSTAKQKATKTVETPKTEEPTEPEKKTEAVVTEDLPKPTEPEKTETIAKTEPKTTKKKTSSTKKKVAKKETIPTEAKPNKAAELAKALENVRLIVEFKDGGKLERPMNDVLKFGVDKGVLTIINKDGSVSKYSILEVTKITVE